MFMSLKHSKECKFSLGDSNLGLSQLLNNNLIVHIWCSCGYLAIPRDVRDLRVDALGFIYHIESLFFSTKFNITIHIWII